MRYDEWNELNIGEGREPWCFFIAWTILFPLIKFLRWVRLEINFDKVLELDVIQSEPLWFSRSSNSNMASLVARTITRMKITLVHKHTYTRLNRISGFGREEGMMDELHIPQWWNQNLRLIVWFDRLFSLWANFKISHFKVTRIFHFEFD